ncbi:MAG: hypothetical protein IJ539_04550 [Prevotella sp.]|nr:hypothetical protein [Prevotella sp.]
MEYNKEKYNGLKTNRIIVKSSLLVSASKIEGATKNTNWEERTIHETIGMDGMDFSTSSGAKKDNTWDTEF